MVLDNICLVALLLLVSGTTAAPKTPHQQGTERHKPSIHGHADNYNMATAPVGVDLLKTGPRGSEFTHVAVGRKKSETIDHGGQPDSTPLSSRLFGRSATIYYKAGGNTFYAAEPNGPLIDL